MTKLNKNHRSLNIHVWKQFYNTKKINMQPRVRWQRYDTKVMFLFVHLSFIRLFIQRWITPKIVGIFGRNVHGRLPFDDDQIMNNFCSGREIADDKFWEAMCVYVQLLFISFDLKQPDFARQGGGRPFTPSLLGSPCWQAYCSVVVKCMHFIIS